MAHADNIDPARWVDEYGDYLYRYALARLHEDSAAQDAVQETFLAAVKGAEKFTGRSSEKTWLVGILKHKVVDYIRKASRERSYEDVSLAEGVIDDSIDRKGHWRTGDSEWRVNPRLAFEQQEFWKVLEQCMEQLQERMRTVFVMRELEGEDADVICKALDITSTNLWVILYRARARLKNCLEENWINANG